ncbi:MAG: hypothetical protein WBH03_08975, partial [Cyclobacteriaceae bacterium]
MGKAKFYTDSYLDTKRQEGDPLADKAFRAIKESPNGTAMRDLMAKVMLNRDSWPDNLPPAAYHYLEQTSLLPSFANPAKMKKGAEVFAKNAEDFLSMLGFA